MSSLRPWRATKSANLIVDKLRKNGARPVIDSGMRTKDLGAQQAAKEGHRGASRPIQGPIGGKEEVSGEC